MTVITFDLPNDIQQGLASGQYKQFGGVIRNATSGQVVAMLKEGGNPEALQQLRNISSITNITTILTQGISIYGYALILSKLNEISGKLDKVINYLEIEKMTEFKSGLKLFDKAIQVKNTKNDIYSNLLVSAYQQFTKSYEFYKDIINKEYYTLYKESKWLNTNNQNKLVEIINIVILSKMGEISCALEMGTSGIKELEDFDLDTTLEDFLKKINQRFNTEWVDVAMNEIPAPLIIIGALPLLAGAFVTSLAQSIVHDKYQHQETFQKILDLPQQISNLKTSVAEQLKINQESELPLSNLNPINLNPNTVKTSYIIIKE